MQPPYISGVLRSFNLISLLGSPLLFLRIVSMTLILSANSAFTTLIFSVGNIRLSYYVSDGILWKVPSWRLYVYIKARPLSLDRNETKLSILSSGSLQCLDKHYCCITSSYYEPSLSSRTLNINGLLFLSINHQLYYSSQ